IAPEPVFAEEQISLGLALVMAGRQFAGSKENGGRMIERTPAIHLDSHGFTYTAPGTVATNQIVGDDSFLLAGLHIGDADRHFVLVLRETVVTHLVTQVDL